MKALSRIYADYGGLRTILKSPYFWVSWLLTAIFYCGLSSNSSWMDLPVRVIPPLVGFTFASFSLLFAIIDDDNRLILSQPDDDFGGRKPILVIVSRIVHSVFMQLCALASALTLALKPIVLPIPEEIISIGNQIATAIVIFLFIYGLSLVFAVATTLYELIDIVADADDLTTYTEDNSVEG